MGELKQRLSGKDQREDSQAAWDWQLEYEVWFRASVKIGIEAARQGFLVSDQEVRRMLKTRGIYVD